jgi:glycine betaine/choline ABC-type transport system substrate-binding protein
LCQPHRGRSAEQIIDGLNAVSMERHGFEWLRPLGTSTDYCLVTTRALAERHGLKRASQLAGELRGQLRFCGNFEFMDRLDGLVGLKSHYLLSFASEEVCSFDDRYDMIERGDADVTIGHTTDPQIAAMDLVILEDDQEFFPRYFEVPMARTAALEQIPELRGALLELAELGLTNRDITALVQDHADNPPSLASSVRARLEHLGRGAQKRPAPRQPTRAAE